MDPLEPDDSQARAVDMILTQPIGVVTGGPGTGKTTSLNTALGLLPARVRVRMAAPTGKAARRMAEATKAYVDDHPESAPCTIHRLLEFKPGVGFTRHASRPISADLIIIDEASMIDIYLFADLMRAVSKRGTRIMFVGDVDQLPPVGPGQPFADIIKSGMVPTARLTCLHRQANDSWVAINAPRVLRGQALDLKPQEGFRWVRVDAVAEVVPVVHRLLLEEGHAETQVLIPQRKGLAGIYAANAALQNVFNEAPERSGEAYLPREHYNIRKGDRVIQTANDYNVGVFNGEIGYLTGAAAAGVVVEFQSGNEVRECAYTPEQSDNLDLAYALTVHRAQGSEFARVICVVHSSHTRMLTRRLMYTAITRTRGRLVLVGDARGLERAISNSMEVQRRTTLVERMRGTLEPITDDSAYDDT